MAPLGGGVPLPTIKESKVPLPIPSAPDLERANSVKDAAHKSNVVSPNSYQNVLPQTSEDNFEDLDDIGYTPDSVFNLSPPPGGLLSWAKSTAIVRFYRCAHLSMFLLYQPHWHTHRPVDLSEPRRTQLNTYTIITITPPAGRSTTPYIARYE